MIVWQGRERRAGAGTGTGAGQGGGVGRDDKRNLTSMVGLGWPRRAAGATTGKKHAEKHRMGAWFVRQFNHP